MKTVSIQGQINRPGVYELKPNETFQNLVEIAGGLKISAYYGRALVDRIIPFNKRDSLKMERMISEVNLREVIEEGKKFEVFDDDDIKIYEILPMRKKIWLTFRVLLQGLDHMN